MYAKFIIQMEPTYPTTKKENSSSQLPAEGPFQRGYLGTLGGSTIASMNSLKSSPSTMFDKGMTEAEVLMPNIT